MVTSEAFNWQFIIGQLSAVDMGSLTSGLMFRVRSQSKSSHNLQQFQLRVQLGELGWAWVGSIQVFILNKLCPYLTRPKLGLENCNPKPNPVWNLGFYGAGTGFKWAYGPYDESKFI